MSLRRSSMPPTLMMSRELLDILQRNGMQATIVTDGAGKAKLMVQGHDSPVLTYNLTQAQLKNLTSYGDNYLNKLSYKTFTDIVANDFDMPRNYVHARNVNTRVAMGLHGYRIGVGEYGRMPMMTPRQAFMRGMPMGFCGNPHQRGFWQVLTPFLGWTGRHQDGFHLRRMGGVLVAPNGAPIVPDRPDGRMRPGELKSGGYGFYWKGNMENAQAAGTQQRPVVIDPLLDFHPDQDGHQQGAELETVHVVPRPATPAIPYNEAITSQVYFSKDKFLEVLSSHGLVVNEGEKTLTVQSSAHDYDITYDLSEEQLDKLTDNSVKDVNVETRLNILNEVVGNDFKDRITMDMLNTKELVNIQLSPEAAEELATVKLVSAPNESMTEHRALEVMETIKADGLVIPLISEKEGYHWEQDARHGRDVVLGNVVAYENKGKAYLRASVNGETFVKELTAKEFQEIQYRNDSRRLELVDMHLDGIHLEKGDYKGEAVNSAVTHGEDLADIARGKGWYREGKDGREVTVGDIAVAKQGAKFIMTAQIDGQTIQHEISQKDFNKFLQMDDFHRMKLFAKIFNEVDIKNNLSVGARAGAAVAAALTVLGELGMSADPMMSVPRGEGFHHGMEHRAYFKPGVDSPMDVAARNFEAAMITEQIQRGLHH